MSDADLRGATRPGGADVGPSDAELVRAACGGDRAAFASIYDRYADRVHAFCLTVLRNPDDAADVTQDTFLLAARRLDQLRDPTRLRSWLFAVARHEAFRRSKQRSRQVAVGDDIDEQLSLDAGPEDTVSRQDAATIVHEAAAGLTEKDRAILDLSLRHGLEGEELGAALGVSGNHASVLAGRVRERVERSLGALLVARLGRDDCGDLQELLAGWDGRFSPLVRKRVARHVDDCATCTATKRRVASPAALLSAVPLVSAPAVLRSQVLEAFDVHAASATTVEGPGSSGGAEGSEGAEGTAAQQRGSSGGDVPAVPLRRDGFPRSDQRRKVVVAAAAVMVLLAVAAGALLVLPGDDDGTQTVASVATEQGLERGISFGAEAPADEPAADAPPATDGGAVAAPDDPAGAPQEEDPAVGTGPAGGGGGAVTVPPPQPPPPPPPADSTGPAVSASPGASTIRAQGCGAPTSTTINATASDPSGIASVHLSPYGGAMSGGGGSWSRGVGPFVPMGPGATPITFTVTATDTAGNSSSTTTQVIVVGC